MQNPAAETPTRAAPELAVAQTALVLGLGDSGLAMARWLARSGVPVRVWDSRSEPPQAAALEGLVPGAQRSHADVSDPAAIAALLDGVGALYKSPGLSPADERLAPLLVAATAAGLRAQGELDLFAQALTALKIDCGYTPQVLAITGTNGKTTTTTLTGLLVERTGRRVAVAGNIGPTLLGTLADALDAQADAPLPEVWVLELSSFQLHDVHGFEPDAAVVLNITEDHLDWHGSLDAYAADKARIYGQSAVMVINRDDPRVEGMAPHVPEANAVAGRSSKSKAPSSAPRRIVRFGLNAPRAPGDFGWVLENGMAWLVRAQSSDEVPSSRTRRAGGSVDNDAELHLQRLMPADALRIRGRHNAANALAALALATAVGCPLAPMLHGLREYTGEPHRVQHVATVAEVDYFDDSKGTNVGATVAAIAGLAQDRSPAKLVLILGGDGKGQDFSPLREPLASHARAVALIGRDAQALAQALRGLDFPCQGFDTLPEATRWAAQQAQRADAVVLSPACASLDMFRNYAHRAEVFVAEVQAMAAEEGGMGC
jgi:UDP-N-acetylmuramoylalanine--D-glutamate ligase